MKYLFAGRSKIKKFLSAKHIYLFLDYDGTLVPLADTPCAAVMPGSTRALLYELSGSPCFKLAVVSGRSLSDIKKMLGLKNIIYAANHGLEIEGPNIKFKYRLPSRITSALSGIYEKLSKKLSKFKGVLIEDKTFSVALHYRKADKKDLPLIKAVFYESVKVPLAENKIIVRASKMLLEALPAVRWGKGKAVLWLLARQKFSAASSGIMPVYLGDDATDEDAFKALAGRGLTIFVGRPGQDSRAEYFLKDVYEVKKFLKEILRVKKDTLSGRKDYENKRTV